MELPTRTFPSRICNWRLDSFLPIEQTFMKAYWISSTILDPENRCKTPIILSLSGSWKATSLGVLLPVSKSVSSMGESGREREICSPKGMRTRVMFVTCQTLREELGSAHVMQVVGSGVLRGLDLPSSFSHVSPWTTSRAEFWSRWDGWVTALD